MIQVHHLDNSRSHRILWFLEELGLEYEVVKYQRDPQTMSAPASLKQIHPLGKSPTISDRGIVLSESGAILDYLGQIYGGGRFTYPAGTPQWVDERYFMHFAEGTMMPKLLVWFNLMRVGEAAKAAADRQQADIIQHFDFLEKKISNSGYFAGPDFTVADVQMSYPVELGANRNVLNAHPSLMKYLKQIQSRPAYRKAVERGGGYRYLLAE